MMKIDLRGLQDESKRAPMDPQRVPESQKSRTGGSQDHPRGPNIAPQGLSGGKNRVCAFGMGRSGGLFAPRSRLRLWLGSLGGANRRPDRVCAFGVGRSGAPIAPAPRSRGHGGDRLFGKKSNFGADFVGRNFVSKDRQDWKDWRPRV